MTEPVEGDEEISVDPEEAEDEEALEATTTLLVFGEEGFWDIG